MVYERTFSGADGLLVLTAFMCEPDEKPDEHNNGAQTLGQLPDG
jgi:hypothetical protein